MDTERKKSWPGRFVVGMAVSRTKRLTCKNSCKKKKKKKVICRSAVVGRAPRNSEWFRLQRTATGAQKGLLGRDQAFLSTN